eukprot:7138293-Prymnesium_polylepis.1
MALIWLGGMPILSLCSRLRHPQPDAHTAISRRSGSGRCRRRRQLCTRLHASATVAPRDVVVLRRCASAGTTSAFVWFSASMTTPTLPAPPTTPTWVAAWIGTELDGGGDDLAPLFRGYHDKGSFSRAQCKLNSKLPNTKLWPVLSGGRPLRRTRRPARLAQPPNAPPPHHVPQSGWNLHRRAHCVL